MINGYNHVLLADDDIDDCEMFEEAFCATFPDIKLSISNNGRKLMDLLKRPPEPRADIIFLDLNMPVKTGIECLEEIRNDLDLENNIVIIFTTSSQQEDVRKLYSLGANYFVTKPSDYNDLQSLIAKALHLANSTGIEQPKFEDFYIKL